jgi:hypothetical protein
MTLSNRDLLFSQKRKSGDGIPLVPLLPKITRGSGPFCLSASHEAFIFTFACDLMVTRWLHYLQPQIPILSKKKGAARRKK